MSQQIHARRRGKRMRYRLWSTITDSYMTGELTEKQLERLVLKLALNHARYVHGREFPNRIDRANRTGSSNHVFSRVPLDSPWETRKWWETKRK